MEVPAAAKAAPLILFLAVLRSKPSITLVHMAWDLGQGPPIRNAVKHAEGQYDSSVDEVSLEQICPVVRLRRIRLLQE